MADSQKTLGPAFEFFERLVTDFTWGRLGFLLAFILFGVATVVVYESHTRTFALARMEREFALLEKIALADAGIREVADEDLASALAGLKARLKESAEVESEGLSWDLESLPERDIQLVCTALPWFVMALFIVIFGSGSRLYGVLGMAVVGVPIVVLTVFLVPVFESAWIHRWLVPWSELFLVVGGILVWQRSKTRGEG